MWDFEWNFTFLSVICVWEGEILHFPYLCILFSLPNCQILILLLQSHVALCRILIESFLLFIYLFFGYCCIVSSLLFCVFFISLLSFNFFKYIFVYNLEFFFKLVVSSSIMFCTWRPYARMWEWSFTFMSVICFWEVESLHSTYCCILSGLLVV